MSSDLATDTPLVSEAESRSERIDALLASGRIGEALARSRQALESGAIEADEGEMRLRLALALGLRGRLAEARLEFDQAARRLPLSSKTRLSWGRVWLSRGRIDEAIDQFGQAVQLEPQNGEAHRQLAEALRIRAKLDAFTELAAERVKRKPNHSQEMFTLAMALVARGRLLESQQLHLDLIRIRPNFAEAHNNLGVTLSRLEMRGDARECYRKALEIKPDCAEASANLASLLYESLALSESLAHAIPPWPEPRSEASYSTEFSRKSEDIPLEEFDWSGFDAVNSSLRLGSPLIPTSVTLSVRYLGKSGEPRRESDAPSPSSSSSA